MPTVAEPPPTGQASEGLSTVIVPGFPAVVSGLALASEADIDVTETGILPVDGLAAIWNVMITSWPSAMMLAFDPHTAKVSPPLLRTFDAETEDAPKTADVMITSEVWVMVNSTAEH